jgi:hypothetical protein
MSSACKHVPRISELPAGAAGLSFACGAVWYGGGKLAVDLSWPKLRQRWTPHRATPAGRNIFWVYG